MAFACLYGQHDYNANPFAPLGMAVEMHVTPANQKMYEAHTKTGFYVGNSWEYYWCHEIWIAETRSMRIGETAFFKDKYLTQPAVTMSDTILRVGDDLCQALKGVIPKNGATRTAVDHLMDIFKKQAKKEETVTNTRRVLRQKAQAQRVQSEEAVEEVKGQWMPAADEQDFGDDDLRTTKPLKAEYPSCHQAKANQPPLVSQDNNL